MKKQLNRVLAYRQARIIENQHLEKISGGKFNLCAKPTHATTGQSSPHVDVQPDIVFD